MSAALCAIFFLSGAAALVFETLWFYQAGIAFGTSIWASSLVLAAFMGGLALGNALSGRLGHRLRRPLRAYALLELAIGASGLALVLALPWLTPLLARALGPFVDAPAANPPPRRAFALLLVPATAMGPRPARRRRAHRPTPTGASRALYGWNTPGAVVEPCGRAFLFERFDPRQLLPRSRQRRRLGALAPREGAAGRVAARVLPALPRAAFIWLGLRRGLAPLALEVVWFRIAFSTCAGQPRFAACSPWCRGVGLGGLRAGGSSAGGRRPRLALPLAAGARGREAWRRCAPRSCGALARAASSRSGRFRRLGILFTLLGELDRSPGDALGRAAHAREHDGRDAWTARRGFPALPRLGMEASLAHSPFHPLAARAGSREPGRRAPRGPARALRRRLALACALPPVRCSGTCAPRCAGRSGDRPRGVREGSPRRCLS
jgi:hypothetical protein